MNLENDRELARRIVDKMPANEEQLAMWLGTTREHIAAICMTLAKARKIKLDKKWDAPRHWKAA